MAALMKFICIVILCSLIIRGESQPCAQSNLVISQTATGQLVQNVPEWKLTITNNCICSQQSVKLNCDGFQSLETVDPSVMSQSGSVCLVEQPIYGNQDFSVNYASANSFPFAVLSSQIMCS